MRRFPHDESNINIGLINQNETIKGNEEPVEGVTLSKISELWANSLEQEARNPTSVFPFKRFRFNLIILLETEGKKIGAHSFENNFCCR